MILLLPEPDLPDEKDPLCQIHHHGEGCLQECSDGAPTRYGSGRARAPTSGLCIGPRWEGMCWGNAGNDRRIWGPGAPRTSPSRPPARDSMGEDDAGTYTDVSVRNGIIPKMVISPTTALLLMCMCLKLSMVLWVSMHTINGISTPLVCCSAHSEGAMCDVFWASADGHGVNVNMKLNAAKGILPFFFDQSLEEVICKLHKYSDYGVNCWTHISIRIHMFRTSSVLAFKISDLCLQPMVFVAPDLECERWNIIFSVSLWSQVNIIARILRHHSCSHTTNKIHGQQRSRSCLCARKIIKIGNAIKVQNSFFMIPTCTKFCLADDHLVEDAVPSPFGLCHQRCTTTSLSLIPRFNGRDPLRLSLVMLPQNFQLNPPQPRVHTPDRPSGEPPAGHQLVWSAKEAPEDCRCSNIESVLSTNERSLFGFIRNLWYQLQAFRSSFFLFVRLGTFDPCSTPRRREMLYYEL